MRASRWTEYLGFVTLLRLPGTEGPITREYDRGPTQAGCPRSGGERMRN